MQSWTEHCGWSANKCSILLTLTSLGCWLAQDVSTPAAQPSTTSPACDDEELNCGAERIVWRDHGIVCNIVRLLFEDRQRSPGCGLKGALAQLDSTATISSVFASAVGAVKNNAIIQATREAAVIQKKWKQAQRRSAAKQSAGTKRDHRSADLPQQDRCRAASGRKSLRLNSQLSVKLCAAEQHREILEGRLAGLEEEMGQLKPLVQSLACRLRTCCDQVQRFLDGDLEGCEIPWLQAGVIRAKVKDALVALVVHHNVPARRALGAWLESVESLGIQVRFEFQHYFTSTIALLTPCLLACHVPSYDIYLLLLCV